MPDTPSQNIARFDGFELDLAAGELQRNGRIVRLPEQQFQILQMLLVRQGQMVSREEIRKRLWPNDTVVEFDRSINAAIMKLRSALGDSADTPRFIETVARRGYRMLVPVLLAEALSPVGPAKKVGDSSLVGLKVSHYRVLTLLGGGGMGLVYKAEDLKLNRPVALKFLPEELRTDSVTLQRFEREARTASWLSHPNICTIYGVEEHGTQPFIVMELLEGETLRELISGYSSSSSEARSHLPLERLLEIGIQIADGLDAAHRAGIIHRDLKPANIFVTISGRVKILDFGLAKVAKTETDIPYDFIEENGKMRSQTAFRRESSLEHSLSRTGIAMGTAGYMSPEQVRGEGLDFRTDLFSFGLILFEMVTGQRVFSGDTAAIVEDAILNRDPRPVREFRPHLPTKLELIIEKALKKNRELRYQSAGEIRADLEALRSAIAPSRLRLRYAMAIALSVTLLVLGTTFWMSRRRPSPPSFPANFRLRQLTANSAENRIVAGNISPDGGYLAYSDLKELFVKHIETGETRTLEPPASAKGKGLEWAVVDWFPDGNRFVVNARPAVFDTDWYSDGTGIWIFSTLGATPRLLRENAMAWSVSPDGSLIAFTTNKGKLGDRELWLMNSTGGAARKLYETDEDGAFGGILWLPEGKRLLYVSINPAGSRLMSRDMQGGPASVVLSLTESNGVNDVALLSGARLIYAKAEPGAISTTANYWTMQLDPNTGAPMGAPRRLTNWTGFGIAETTSTSDGRRLAFRKWTSRVTVYVADLGAGGTLAGNPQHFTLTESSDLPTAWTHDSKSLIVISNRTGANAIYRQSIAEDKSQLLVSDQNGATDARISPDGKWVVYLLSTEPTNLTAARHVMRIPVNGGQPVEIFPAAASSSLSCAGPQDPFCCVAELSTDQSRLIVTAFDILKGRGTQLLTLDRDANQSNWYVDLSPNGSELAMIRDPAAPIDVVSIAGKRWKEITIKGWTNFSSLHWAADSKSLFVSSITQKGAVLLRVNEGGTAKVVTENLGGKWIPGLPSPDGRHLALARSTNESNIWMMELF